jgi:carboxylesterase type B
VAGEDVVIKTEKGSVKGTKKDFDNGKSFYLQFLGIKYAKAPTGPLRFMVNHALKYSRPYTKVDVFENLEHASLFWTNAASSKKTLSQ